jgi:4-hydroxy-3-polyprenylbenzoate decarboxylase
MAYGLRLLEVLECEKSVILSDDGEKVLRLETGLGARDIRKLASKLYRNNQMEAPIASGSRRFDAMVICPCTMSTASKVAFGISDNLMTRAASVALKERRRLVIVPRETPLSTIHLRNLTTLSEAGAVVLPASPAFYGKPRKLGDLVDFIVGRILDVLNIDNKLYKRWAE